MKTIAFSIQKGGTGKTSIAGNIAWKISQEYKTVIIDGDPQGNITTWFTQDNIQHELSDVLQERVQLHQALQQVGDNLYIIPTFAIGGDLKIFSETLLFQRPFTFIDLNEQLEEMGFEYVIYDLSPGLSQLERSIIMSCQEVVTPLLPEFFATDGLEIFTESLKDIQAQFKRTVNHRIIIINNVNQVYIQHRQRIEKFNQLQGYQVYHIPQDRNIADSQPNHKTLFEYEPASRAIPALETVSTAIMGV